jgi:hypothetical protein
VELLDGNVIDVVSPSLAFCSGAATDIAPGWELVEFSSDKVRDIRPAAAGAAS